MLSASAAQRVLALGIEHGTAIHERVAVLWPAVAAAAASDADVDRYWRGVAANRRGGQRESSASRLPVRVCRRIPPRTVSFSPIC